MADSFRLQVVSPAGEVLDRDVVEVTAPGLEGEFGVLPHHARYMAALGVGELRYTDTGGETGQLALAGGFAEVGPEGAIFLAQTAEDAADIDTARAEAALQRAQQRVAHPDDATDMKRASFALERSRVRLQVAKARGIKPARAGITTTTAPIPGESGQQD